MNAQNTVENRRVIPGALESSIAFTKYKIFSIITSNFWGLNTWADFVCPDIDTHAVAHWVITIQCHKKSIVPAAKQHCRQEAVNNPRTVLIRLFFANLRNCFVNFGFEAHRNKFRSAHKINFIKSNGKYV